MFRGLSSIEQNFKIEFPNQNFHANIWISLPNLIFRYYWFARHLWDEYNISSSLVSGVFHPDQIKKASPLSLLYYKTILLARLLPKGSVYFMNDACKSSTRNKWGYVFDNFPIHNLYLEQEQNYNIWKPRKSSTLRVVSVGRLVSFKSYNYTIARTVNGLRERGISIVWDIYGDGPDKTRLEDEVVASGLDYSIHFKGNLSYDQLAHTIGEYDVFVGMGTAALEAAQVGMPTVLAIASSGDLTYGFLFEAPSDSVGEKVEGVETTPIIDVLDRYSKLSDCEKRRIGRACQEDAQKRSNGERAPFSTMFGGGLHYPPGRLTIRSMLLSIIAKSRRANRYCQGVRLTCARSSCPRFLKKINVHPLLLGWKNCRAGM
jgi:hypothetical protein